MIHQRPFLDRSLRQAVYDYDGYRCRHCGSGQLTLDHIVPRVLGGPDTFENLQTLCSRCNSRKGCAPFVLPVREKKPQPRLSPGLNWRLHVPKAALKPALPNRTPRRPQRRRYWEMMALKYPMAFHESQPVYRPRERLRVTALRNAHSIC